MADKPRPRESLVRAILPGLELREASSGSKPVLTGHFSVFNSWTTIRSAWEGTFLERVAPGAFRKSFAERTPKVLLEHGKDPMLGNKPIGVATELREDDTGAYYEVDLFDGIPPLVLDGLRAGAYGASFRFSVMNEDYVDRPKRSAYNPEGLPERTIKEARVAEFGPVTFGAYEDATAGVRSLTDRFLLDALAEDPENLRELISSRRSRTVVAMAPNARVTFTSRGDVIEEKLESLDEQRVDSEDLSCLGQMLAMGAEYIAEQDETDEAGNVAKMEAILADLSALVTVEAGEDEPADDEMNSAEPEGQISEPERSAATTPVPGSEEPEPSAATTHRNNVDLEIDLYIPNRKDEPLWRL